ncbi:unnamed protein product [Penicillium pancosmium]
MSENRDSPELGATAVCCGPPGSKSAPARVESVVWGLRTRPLDESGTAARLRALEIRFAALERRVQSMDNSAASPVRWGLTTVSEETVKKSVLAYTISGIERVIARFSSRMDRRDSLVDAQLGHREHRTGAKQSGPLRGQLHPQTLAP